MPMHNRSPGGALQLGSHGWSGPGPVERPAESPAWRTRVALPHRSARWHSWSRRSGLQRPEREGSSSRRPSRRTRQTPQRTLRAADNERQLPLVITPAQFICDPMQRTFELAGRPAPHPLRPGRRTGIEDLGIPCRPERSSRRSENSPFSRRLLIPLAVERDVSGPSDLSRCPSRVECRQSAPRARSSANRSASFVMSRSRPARCRVVAKQAPPSEVTAWAASSCAR